MAEVRTTPGVKAALTIAGSDSSGGAGLQADLRTLAVMGVHGASAVTAITAQNTKAVKESQALAPKLVDAQIDAVAGDLLLSATKTGMLANADLVRTVARAISRHNLFPLVVDPVMVSKSGDSLIDDAAVSALRDKLLPQAALITPNAQEAARLVDRDRDVDNVQAAGEVGREICQKLKVKACLVTGLHRPNDEEGEAVDVLCDADGTQELTAEWRQTNHTHGAGCVLSAAITGGLALEQPLEEAIETGRNLVAEAIRQATDLGQGHSPVNPMAWMAVKK
ncbi:MAG: bifunctional hydroxymethylpyrimidine kinase/phosphomethylpyrimidine kinase [Phycisphaeraceae bacterium]|nr:bifunctional hydroxymethylpyrimidine kinase/phosphomethylpyrimidine kinase [Phycisphaeraceae bacterium]